MKHFRVIFVCLCAVIVLLFTANIVFMVKLYASIKERYINDVEQCLRRADQIEIVDRLIGSGFGDEDGVLWLRLGLQKSDVGTSLAANELLDMGYSQGYRRMDKQLMAVTTQYLHAAYDSLLPRPDMADMEEAFRRDLIFSGYQPENVHIVGPDDKFDNHEGLWKIEYSVDDNLKYYGYISPLTNDILREMSGVIVTSALIALALTSGFAYLLHIIKNLRSLEEMKDDFTNNMTHELKTPIAIAYAANDALLQFPDPEDEQRTSRYLSASLEQLARLSGMVENILSMSMERRRNLTMSKEEIKLRPFLEIIAGQQKMRADKPCDIKVECDDELTLCADETHLSNVINNLLDNSIKYSGDRVRITIRAAEEEISVTDDGIGIPERSLPEIFKKFYRVPHGNTSRVRGYGIGLYYVRTIVEKHGWKISVQSRPGAGSTFKINTGEK